MNDDDLPQLRAPASGRRTDDAFARAVADDVKKRKQAWSPLWLAVPSLAGAAAVVVLVGTPKGVDAHAVYASFADHRGDVDVFDDDADVLAFADDVEDDFAIPGLAGSSDGELENIEAALDRALKL